MPWRAFRPVCTFYVLRLPEISSGYRKKQGCRDADCGKINERPSQTRTAKF